MIIEALMAKLAETSVPGANTGVILQRFFESLNCSLLTVTNDVDNVYLNIDDESWKCRCPAAINGLLQ